MKNYFQPSLRGAPRSGATKQSASPEIASLTSFARNDRVLQKAQASIEATLSLICLALLLMGGLRIYLWSAKHAVARQQEYEKDRVKATEKEKEKGEFILPKESDLPKLAIFDESGVRE